GPVDGPERLAARFPACEAAPGLAVAHRSSGFAGRVVALDGDDVVVAGLTGLEKRFRNAPGSFSVGAQAVKLIAPSVPKAATKGRWSRKSGATTSRLKAWSSSGSTAWNNLAASLPSSPRGRGAASA